MVVENSVNKNLYKVTLELLKVIPMLLAFCDALHTILDLCGVDAPALSYFGGISFLTLAFLYLISFVFRFCVYHRMLLLPMIFLYLASYCFKFCSYHRMFLHYVLVNNIISTLEFTVGLPVNFLGLYCIFSINLCIFAFLILYFYRREKLCYK